MTIPPSRERGSWLVTPDKFLSPAQVQQLRARLEADRLGGVESADRYAVRNAAIVETLLGTGLRVSEGAAHALDVGRCGAQNACQLAFERISDLLRVRRGTQHRGAMARASQRGPSIRQRSRDATGVAQEDS